MERRWSRKEIKDYCDSLGIKYYFSQEENGYFDLKTKVKMFHGPWIDSNGSSFFIAMPQNNKQTGGRP